MAAKAETYVFGDFRFVPAESLLLKNDEAVALPPKALNVLKKLVENAGSIVTKDDLLRDVWDDMAIEEAAVARTVFLVRAALGDDPKNHTFIRTVPKRGYRFVAEVSTLNGSNGQAIQAEPIEDVPAVPAVDAQPGSAAEPRRFSGLHLAVVLLLLAAVTTGAYLSFFIDVPASKKPSLLIMPVTSAGNGDELIENGIADALIHHLASSNEITVRPLSATRSYSGKTTDPLQAGLEQKVRKVLSASYQRADGKLRIMARLINVETAETEESWKFETGDEGVFAIQDAVAADLGNKIAFRLGATLGPVRVRGTTSEEAYRLYLHAKNLTMRRNSADAKKAVEYLEQALRLDPNFALGYAQMAHAYRKSNLGGEQESEKVKEFINRALELDPNMADAYVARANELLVPEWNFAAAEKDLTKAIELEPNNDAAHWGWALLLANRGRFDEALTEIEIAQSIDPSAVMYMFHRGRILYYARRYDEAITQYKQAIDLDDRFMQPHGWLVRAFEMKGNYAGAFESFINREERAARMDGERLEIYKKTYETTGWTGLRRKWLEVETSDAGLFDFARLSAMQGEKDAAFEYLNKAIEKREWLVETLNVEPALDSLRDDPRFVALQKRVAFEGR